MRTLTISMRALSLLLIAACGDVAARQLPDGGATPDARPGSDADVPVSDAPDTMEPPVIGPLERFDWRASRGAPIATRTVTLPAATLYAVAESGFTLQSDRANPLGSTLTWHDLAGTPGRQHDHLTPSTLTSVSPDATRALFVSTEAVETCSDSQGAFQVLRGTQQLLDVATGEVHFELPVRTTASSAPGFTPLNDWFVTAPNEGTACLAPPVLRSTTAPFAPPPGLAVTDQIVQPVDARRWIVIRKDGSQGLVDPLTPGSFRSFGDDTSPSFDITQGWVHAHLGYADLSEEVVSLSPTGAMRQTALRDSDWFNAGARGRWVRICGRPQEEGYRDCRVIDGQGELAAVSFRITFAFNRPDDAVLLTSGAVVFVGPVENAPEAVQRIDLASGRRETLHVGDGALRSLGDGAAALLLQRGSAWLIEGSREELLAENVTQVVSVPRLPLPRLAGRQDDLALLVSSGTGGRSTLAMLDLRTRRLATVTDNLYFTPPFGGGPFAFSDGCGQPWATRTAGSMIEGLFQQPRHLFFVEQGTPSTIWLMPIDLSTPPRRLAELAGDPSACHAPLASPGGGRVGFAEDGAGGATTRITLSAEK